MSNRKKRKKRPSATNTQPHQSVTAVDGDKVKDQRPSQPETNKEPKQGIVDWVRRHKLTTLIGGVFVFSLGGPLNFFGSNPRIFYFPAIVACILFCWIVMSVTHRFVDSKLTESASKAAPPLTQQANPTIEQAIKSYSRNAMARQWQPPELLKQVGQQPGGTRLVLVKVGGMATRWPVGSEELESAPDRPSPVILPGGRIVIPYIRNNRVYVKTQTPFGDANKTIQMNNEWPGTTHPGWDKNFDTTSFEIVDDKMLPVLQVRYDAADAIEVYGIFVAPNGSITVAFGDDTKGTAPGIPMPQLPERKAWFKYPSSQHPGDHADK